MTFGEKLCSLRKKSGMSQEDLADMIKVSRQAVSRWETAGILPDAENIIKLSRLFGVSADYLLHDEYSSDADIPAVKDTTDEMKKEQNRQIAFTVCIGILIMLEVFAIAGWVVFQRVFMISNAVMGQIAVITTFEVVYRKYQNQPEAAAWRRRYYRFAIWLTAYFPIRFVMTNLWTLYPRPVLSLWIECSYAAAYLTVCVLVSWRLRG